MKKITILIMCFAFICLLTSCKTDDSTHNPTVSSDPPPNESTSISYKQQLSDFNSLTSNDIREIDIVYVRPAEDGKCVYKTFGEKSEIQDILSILAKSNISETEPVEAANGWTLLVRIWLTQKGVEVNQPILIAPHGSDYITISGYRYSVENNQYTGELVQYFNASAIEEKAYLE